MTNHPNRSKRNPSAAANPKPDQILAARTAAGMTQKEAAELIHCHVNTWAQWENNERRMHPAFLELFQLKEAARRLGFTEFAKKMAESTQGS